MKELYQLSITGKKSKFITDLDNLMDSVVRCLSEEYNVQIHDIKLGTIGSKFISVEYCTTTDFIIWKNIGKKVPRYTYNTVIFILEPINKLLDKECVYGC